MGILVLLAVFTEHAADTSGRSFALVYAVFLVVQTVLWFTVWRQDRRDHPEYQAATGGYVVGMAVSVVVILASAALSATPHASSCGPALPPPGSWASCWPPGAPVSASA